IGLSTQEGVETGGIGLGSAATEPFLRVASVSVAATARVVLRKRLRVKSAAVGMRICYMTAIGSIDKCPSLYGLAVVVQFESRSRTSRLTAASAATLALQCSMTWAEVNA